MSSARIIFVCSIKTDNSMMVNFDGCDSKARLENETSSEAE